MSNRHSRKIFMLAIGLSLVLAIGMFLPGSGYSQTQQAPQIQKNTVPEGKPTTVKGVIMMRDGETFIMRDINRTDTTVVLSDATKIRTERKGLFRGLKPFDVTALDDRPYRGSTGQR